MRKHTVWPRGAPATLASIRVVDVALGGFFYDYFRRPSGTIAGVRYWLLEPADVDEHPVFSQFKSDERFLFDRSARTVDFVFDNQDAESLRTGKLSEDVAQDFGGERVLKSGEYFGIEFSLPS